MIIKLIRKNLTLVLKSLCSGLLRPQNWNSSQWTTKGEVGGGGEVGGAYANRTITDMFRRFAKVSIPACIVYKLLMLLRVGALCYPQYIMPL